MSRVSEPVLVLPPQMPHHISILSPAGSLITVMALARYTSLGSLVPDADCRGTVGLLYYESWRHEPTNGIEEGGGLFGDPGVTIRCLFVGEALMLLRFKVA